MRWMDRLLRLLDRAAAMLKEFLDKCFHCFSELCSELFIVFQNFVQNFSLFFRTWLVCTGCPTSGGRNQRLRYPFATKGARIIIIIIYLLLLLIITIIIRSLQKELRIIIIFCLFLLIIIITIIIHLLQTASGLHHHHYLFAPPHHHRHHLHHHHHHNISLLQRLPALLQLCLIILVEITPSLAFKEFAKSDYKQGWRFHSGSNF